MEKLELANSILSDLANFVLVVFGFSVTLFTVIYSFVLSKREQIKEYSDKIKLGNDDPLVVQRHSNALKFIIHFKRFNKHLIVIIFSDLIVYLACMIIKYFISNIEIKETATIISAFLAAVILIYVAIMLTLTVKDYLKVTKI